MCDIHNDIQGRKGINAVSSCFTNIGWIFRENPHTDYGIDGEVEQTLGKPTGSRIALQIKSGPSYLKENKDGNIIFRIDEWHYKYWLQSNIPVLIMFYDERNNKIIWEQVKIANIKQTNTQYKIEINPTKYLTVDSIEDLNNIIATYKRHYFYELDESCETYEFSQHCYNELDRSIKEACEDLSHFRMILKAQIKTPNLSVLTSAITSLARKVQIRTSEGYEYLHKGCWYLKKMANIISPPLFEIQRQCVNAYIEIIDRNITIWKSIANDINVLNHPSIPINALTAIRQCISIIEDQIATLALVRYEYNACNTI